MEPLGMAAREDGSLPERQETGETGRLALSQHISVVPFAHMRYFLLALEKITRSPVIYSDENRERESPRGSPRPHHQVSGSVLPMTVRSG